MYVYDLLVFMVTYIAYIHRFILASHSFLVSPNSFDKCIYLRSVNFEGCLVILSGMSVSLKISKCSQIQPFSAFYNYEFIRSLFSKFQ